MGLEALKGFERFTKTKVKKVVSEAIPDPIEEAKITQEPVIVRTPRTTTSAMEKRVDALREGNTIMPADKEKTEITKTRRASVTEWLMNGHTYAGELMSIHQLAKALKTPRRVIMQDVEIIKSRFAKFYTETDDTKEVAALAHLLMEMKFQDRGRALLLYNIIMNDIKESDNAEQAYKQQCQAQQRVYKPTASSLTGRDRAAMYSAALASLGEASKATAGMDQLFKMTGGAQKLQTIIKNVTINKQTNNVVGIDALQQLVNNMMGNVLPSGRPTGANLPTPKFLEMDEEDLAVMQIGEAEVQVPRSKRGKNVQEEN